MYVILVSDLFDWGLQNVLFPREDIISYKQVRKWEFFSLKWCRGWYVQGITSNSFRQLTVPEYTSIKDTAPAAYVCIQEPIVCIHHS